MLASPPIDFHVSDTYFVVAHFHYVLFGTIVFAVFAGIYFWFPKMTGRVLNELLGRVHFWTLFVGFHLTFLVQHWLGLEGDAAAVRRLPAHRRLHHPEHDLHHRVVPARRLDAAVPVECVALAQARRAGRRGRPVGLRQLTRVGDELPAAAAQLHHHPADPLGAAGLRPALPARGRADRAGGHPRAARLKARPSPVRDLRVAGDNEPLLPAASAAGPACGVMRLSPARPELLRGASTHSAAAVEQRPAARGWAGSSEPGAAGPTVEPVPAL